MVEVGSSVVDSVCGAEECTGVEEDVDELDEEEEVEDDNDDECLVEDDDDEDVEDFVEEVCAEELEFDSSTSSWPV